MSITQTPICMAEEYWMNTHLTVARVYGGISYNGQFYKVVNKQGISILELSDPGSKYYVGDGDRKAIEPGEPADLCRADFIPFYKKLGREAFIQVLEEHPRTPDTDLKKIYKELTKKSKKHGTVQNYTSHIGNLFGQQAPDAGEK